MIYSTLHLSVSRDEDGVRHTKGEIAWRAIYTYLTVPRALTAFDAHAVHDAFKESCFPLFVREKLLASGTLLRYLLRGAKNFSHLYPYME